MRSLALLALGGGALLFGQRAPELPLNQRVMVVYNAGADNSRKVARYYMEKRNIPSENLCKVDTLEVNEWTEDERFNDEIGKPIRGCLKKLGKDKILYIVLAYNFPSKVTMNQRSIAVDSWIADIWDEYAKPGVMGQQAGDQPYFGQAQSQGNAYEPYLPFVKYRERPNAKTIYSVWRLDAPTPQLAMGLVDKALYAEANGLHGKACFDLNIKITPDVPDNGYPAGNWDLYRAAQMAKKAGFDVTMDENEKEFGEAPAPLRCDDAALYAGWYSFGYHDAFSWVPGAIGFHLDSASAINFRTGNNWVTGAIRRGITVTSGSVNEPFLEGLAHPDQVFLYLFQGANVGDAVLRSTRWIKWLILNVGDPLYRPFPNGAGAYAVSKTAQESWFGLAPNTVVGGGTVRAQFMLTEKREQSLPLILQTNYPQLVTLPSNVQIPPNLAGATFQIPVKTPGQATSVMVTLSVGNEKLSNTINVYPFLADLSLSQPSMKAGESVTGKISLLAPAKESGFTVKLSSNQARIIVPEEIQIPPGARQATFAITGKPVTAEITATITAKLDNASKTAQLKVTPDSDTGKP